MKEAKTMDISTKGRQTQEWNISPS